MNKRMARERKGKVNVSNKTNKVIMESMCGKQNVMKLSHGSLLHGFKFSKMLSFNISIYFHCKKRKNSEIQ